MKSGTRNLIVVAASIAVLGGAVAALTLTGQGTGSSASSSASSSIELISKKSSDVSSMTVKNQNGSYKLVPQVVPASSTSTVSSGTSSGTSSSSTTTTYMVEGLSGLPVDTDLTSSVFQNGYSLVASQDLGKVDKLDEFGLKNPKATVVVSFKDGSSVTYLIGNESAADSTAYYMCTKDSSRVYVVSVDSGLFESKNYFIKKEILSISSSSGTNDFTSIVLSGKNYAQSIAFATSGSELVMTSPVKASTDQTNLSSLETALTSVTAASVEAVNPDAAALKKYGLDNPSAVASFTVNKGSYKILAGAKTGDNYYVMLDKGHVVYQVAADSIDAWVKGSVFTLRSKLVFLPSITAVKSVVFMKGSNSSVVNITRTKDEKTSTEDTTAYTYTVKGTSGKKLDYDKAYQPFYAKLIAVELLEASSAKPSGSPVYTLEYRYFDKSGTDTVQFYSAGDRRYLAVVNGQTVGIVTSSDVDAVYTLWQQLQNGKSIS